MKPFTHRPSLLMFFLVLSFVGLVLQSCASKEEKIKGHYERGLEYAKQEKVDEAAIEFRNVIQLSPDHADAKYELAKIYMEKGEEANLRNAFKFLSEAVQAKPDLIDAQMRLGLFFFLSNDFEHAKEKADLVLSKEPDNQDALLVRARVDVREQQFDAAIKGFEKLLLVDPNRLSLYYELSELHAGRKDYDAAETLLQKALSLEPKNAVTHAGLGRFYQVKEDGGKAEVFYKKAVSLDPKNKNLYFPLAGFYQTEKRFDDAERVLTDALKIDPKDAGPHIILGDFYMTRQKWGEAEAAFLKAKPLESERHESRKRLVRLYLLLSEKEKLSTTIDEILKKTPKDPDGLYFRARVLLSEKKVAEAADLFREVSQLRRDYPTIHYYLAQIHLVQNEVQQARTELIQAVKLEPNHVPARLSLAEIYLRSQSFELVMETVDPALEIDPENIQANILKGDAALGLRQAEKGEIHYRNAIQYHPKNPIGHFRMGLLRLAQKKNPEALSFFEKSLSLNPNLVDALSQIVGIKLRNKDINGAIQRVSAQIERIPENGVLRRLRGGLYSGNQEPDKAVADLKKAIELNPNDLAAYLDLGNLYGRQKEYARAIQELDEGIQRNPKIPQPYMLKGVIYDAQQQYDKAQEQYEKVLELDPKFAPAANNLAWIYAEQGGNIDKALSLAQIAKERFPDDPSVSDTLGWIYYKKNVFLKAISLLQESAEKLSDNPVVRYHLGMAYAKEGKAELAKTELTAALKLNPEFPGSDEAEKTLKGLP
ncbi:MAG: tetratricopeptide repeat protein [Nitrospiria bacterium]